MYLFSHLYKIKFGLVKCQTMNMMIMLMGTDGYDHEPGNNNILNSYLFEYVHG